MRASGKFERAPLNRALTAPGARVMAPAGRTRLFLALREGRWPRDRIAYLLMKPIIALFIALCTLGVGASPTYGQEPVDSGIRRHYTTDSSAKIFVIGNTTFSIPAAYVFRREERGGTRTTALTLIGILPGIQHFSSSNAHEFECKGHCNRIEFTIRTRHKTPGSDGGHQTVEQFVREFSKFHEDAKPTGKALYGLRVIDYAQGQEQLLVKYVDSKPVAFVRCQNPGTRVSPGCSGFLDYSDELVVSFRYGRTHLPSAAQIQDQLASKVADWEAAARINRPGQ